MGKLNKIREYLNKMLKIQILLRMMNLLKFIKIQIVG